MDDRGIVRQPVDRARITRVGVARARRDESGVTLIEVVIAAVLLAVLSSAVLAIILNTQKVEVGNRGRVAAANLAAREIDMVRAEFARSAASPVTIADAGVVTNPDPLDGGTAGQPLSLNGIAFTVVRSASWNITGTGHSACEGGALVTQPNLEVTVSVTWPHMGNIKPVVSNAIFAPAKGTGVPTTAAFVAVSVSDSHEAPSSGRAVRVANGADVHTGITDESGCAVVQVNPATGAGTAYTASLGDVGYVDISGNANPYKATGLVTQGQLNGPVPFAYDLAGQVRLTLVDPSGAPLTDAAVAGAQVTLVAGQSSGARRTPYPLTGVVTLLTGMWPTQYGAYFGLTPPLLGYTSEDLSPGGTVELTVPFALATTSITNIPMGTTSVIAVPHAAGTTCTTAGNQTVPTDAVALMPGNWDFFAVGTNFVCSSGPPAVALDSGSNDPIVWGTTTLWVKAVPAVPAGNALWALERGKAGASLTTCPTSVQAATAQNLDAARTGPVVLPAGDWYLYLTNGAAADGTCVQFPTTTINPRAVAYGVATVVNWPPPTPVVVKVTNVPNLGSRWSPIYPTIVASATTIPASTSCTSSSFPGGPPQSLGTGASSVTGTLAQGTWYIYYWDKRTGFGIPDSTRCKLGGTVIAGSNSPLPLSFNTTIPVPVVGP